MLVNYLYMCVVFGLCLSAVVKSYKVLPGNVFMYVINQYQHQGTTIKLRKFNDGWCLALGSCISCCLYYYYNIPPEIPQLSNFGKLLGWASGEDVH